jgi:hypothetical protein
MPEPLSPGFPAMGLHPAYAAKALSDNTMISDRLYGLGCMAMRTRACELDFFRPFCYNYDT